MRKIFVAHNTCLNASYDFNVLKESLRRHGYELVSQAEEADEVIFSGCGARQFWVDDVIRQVSDISRQAPGRKITVTGCVRRIDPERLLGSVENQPVLATEAEIVRKYTGMDFYALDASFAQDSNHDFEGATPLNRLRTRVSSEHAKVVAALEQVDREYDTTLEGYYRSTTRGFVFYRETAPVEFITISRSCIYRCSYCAIPNGRGTYSSVPLSSIMDKARRAMQRGITRFVLLGDEVGNYGVDLGRPTLPDMLRSILELDAGISISIRYIEPTPFLRFFGIFQEYCPSGRIELLYVPLQAGSQRILRAMNRNYDLEKVSEKITLLRNESPVRFFGNWMVGFPGETEEDFQKTVAIARRLRFQINSAVSFSPRPSTAAPAFPDQVPDEVKEHRLTRLRSLLCDMKVDDLGAQLNFLEGRRRNDILENVRAAEAIQMQDVREPLLLLRQPVVRG